MKIPGQLSVEINTAGVLDLTNHPEWIEAALRKTAVGDVWGIGRRWSAMLEDRGIQTAHDLANAQDGWVRQRMGIVGLRTVHELRGLVCHALDDQPAPRQTTCCSRTFGEATDQMLVQIKLPLDVIIGRAGKASFYRRAEQWKLERVGVIDEAQHFSRSRTNGTYKEHYGCDSSTRMRGVNVRQFDNSLSLSWSTCRLGSGPIKLLANIWIG